MAGIESVKVGKKLLLDGMPFEVLKSEHLKVAMGKGMEKTVLKNLITGNTMQKTFREVDKIEYADITYTKAECSYMDNEGFHFMDVDTFEMITLDASIIGDAKSYISEGDSLMIQNFNGKPINVALEPSVVLEVIETPPGEKGDTVTGGRKPATLNTGLVIQVPLFMKEGEKIKVDTRTGAYISRA